MPPLTTSAEGIKNYIELEIVINLLLFSRYITVEAIY